NNNAKELLLAPDKNGNTPLHLAASQGHPNVIAEILKNNNAKELLLAPDKNGNTPLHLAASQGHPNVIAEILKNGSARELLLAKDKDGNTPLHLAVIQKNINVIAEILKNGNARELLLAKDKDGNTPLHLAVKNRNIPVVNEMLDAAKKMGVGARAELLLAPNHYGDTPLHLAAVNQDVSLIETMASPNQKEEDVITYAFLNLHNRKGLAAVTLIQPEKQATIMQTHQHFMHSRTTPALIDALQFYKEIHQQVLTSEKTAAEVCEDHLKIAMQKRFTLTTTLIQNHLTFIGLDETTKNEVINRCEKKETVLPRNRLPFTSRVAKRVKGVVAKLGVFGNRR
ncbi:MAG: ankyrin repeat domain-containing protein, partial [Rickettsiales bacterium]